MSIEALSWAFAQEHVDPCPRFVLVALANRANEEGGDLYPSLRWIKKKTGFSERAIRNYIAELQELGLLMKTDRVREDGGRTSNEYQLSIAQPGLPLTPPAQHAGGSESRAGGGAQRTTQPRNSVPGAPAPGAGLETKEEKKETREKKASDAGSAPERKVAIPKDFKLTAEHRAWSREHGFEPYLEAHFAYFVDWASADRAKRKYTDWDAAFRSCVRSDWGDVRKNGRQSFGRGAAPIPLEWWKTLEGLNGRARELGVERKAYPGAEEHQQQTLFVYDVYAAAGDGPWLNKRSDSEQRLYREACERRTKATA